MGSLLLVNSLLLVKVLAGVAQHGPGHGCGVVLEKLQQPRAVVLPGLPEHATGGLVDEVVVVVEQGTRDPERVPALATSKEVLGGQDSGTALPHVARTSELVENPAGLVDLAMILTPPARASWSGLSSSCSS